MLDRIHKLNKADPFVQNIADAIQNEQNEQVSKAEQIRLNMFFDTCTLEMLERYEEECGITQKAEKEEDRRAAVEAKWKTSTKCDIDFLRLLAESWQHGETSIDYINDVIKVTFSSKGIPTDLNGLKSALEEARPAHIPIEYIFNFNTWAELKKFTWAELKAETWESVKEKV